MKHENLQFPEVIEMLADKAGIALPDDGFKKQGDDGLSNQLYKLNQAACQFFEAHLAHNKAASDYLAERGIEGEALKTFRIGYAPDSWEALLQFFKKKGVEGAILEKAGLVIAGEKAGHYDRFRNRITFPILDIKDRVLGFGARVLDASLPKYLNSPETTIYSKGRNLYGLNLSKDHIRREGYALIVEGYLDFIVPFQAGVKNIIATLGTALTVDQIRLIKRYANTVIVVYDPDEAGEAASLRSLDLFVSEEVNVYVAELTNGLDPDCFVREFGAEAFVKAVRSGKNLFDYKFDKLSRRFDVTTTNGKTAVANEMVPTLAKIQNAVMKADLIKRLASKLFVDEDAIKEELSKAKPSYEERRLARSAPEVKRDIATAKGAEMTILALMLDKSEFRAIAAERISADELKSTSIRDLVSAIFDMQKKNLDVTPSRLISYLGNNTDTATLVSEAVNILESIVDGRKSLDDCIAAIKRSNREDRLAWLKEEMNRAHVRGDDVKYNECAQEFTKLVKMDRA